MHRVTSRTFVLATILSGLATVIACSGAETQDVLSTQVGTSTASSSSSTTSSGTSGTSGTGTSSSTTSSSTTSSSGGDPPCTDEEEDNDGPGAANDFSGSICGTLGLDGDRADWLRFDMPEGTRNIAINYTGDIRIFLTPPGDAAVEQEWRPGEPINLKPGQWLIRLRSNGGGNDKSLKWALTVTLS